MELRLNAEFILEGRGSVARLDNLASACQSNLVSHIPPISSNQQPDSTRTQPADQSWLTCAACAPSI